MRQETINIYQFKELSDEAKEKARDWYRGCIDQNDYDSVIEDAVAIGELMGIEFDTHEVGLMGGGQRRDPNIWWSGFSCQGDGACFEGSYSYKKGAAKALKEYAPIDETLHRIVDRLQEVQKNNRYQLTAKVENSRSGNYCHEYSVSVDVERKDGKDVTESDEKEVTECLRDFMKWIYRQLEKENEFLYSKENVDEAIEINEYDFYENGERYTV